MNHDHDTSPDATVTALPGPGFESHLDRLARHLREADDLADACSELIDGMRDYGALSPVTQRLVDAHALLITAANTLAAIK